MLTLALNPEFFCLVSLWEWFPAMVFDHGLHCTTGLYAGL